MSEGKVRRGCRDYKNDRTNVYDEERSGKANIQADEIVQQVGQELLRDRGMIRFLFLDAPHDR